MRKFQSALIIGMAIVSCLVFSVPGMVYGLVIFDDDFETDKGWALTGEFQRAAPAGLGITFGGRLDPAAAHGGTFVIGNDLSGLGTYNGVYNNNIAASANEAAVSPTIDCSRYDNIQLGFYRWLGVEKSSDDQARIEVSNDDGGSWNQVWVNPDAHTDDNAWSLQQIDISEWADHQSQVKIRFSLQTDGLTVYQGWNIDDLQVLGEAQSIPTLSAWGMVLFFVFLTAVALLIVKRKRRLEQH